MTREELDKTTRFVRKSDKARIVKINPSVGTKFLLGSCELVSFFPLKDPRAQLHEHLENFANDFEIFNPEKHGDW